MAVMPSFAITVKTRAIRWDSRITQHALSYFPPYAQLATPRGIQWTIALKTHARHATPKATHPKRVDRENLEYMRSDRVFKGPRPYDRPNLGKRLSAEQ